jgi:hypothetical protein
MRFLYNFRKWSMLKIPKKLPINFNNPLKTAFSHDFATIKFVGIGIPCVSIVDSRETIGSPFFKADRTADEKTKRLAIKQISSKL